MSTTWEEFEKSLREEYDDTNYVIERLDHEINVLLQRKQAFMAKDVYPLIYQMDEILDNLDPLKFGGDYFFKYQWYKNLDLESWGIYKYLNVGNKEGFDENTLFVENLDGIKEGSELLIENDDGEKVPRTVTKVQYDEYYEGYLVYLDQDETTWERKWMPDRLYPKCTDPIDEKACVAYNPCSDEFYKPPEWDEDLPEYVESDTVPLKVLYGVGPYTWSFIEGENDGWSLENTTTTDGYNTLYSDNTCDFPAILNVTDACGNTTDEYMVINTSSSEISLNAPSVIYQGDDYIVTIDGGYPPFEWEIREQAAISSCTDEKCVTLQNTTTSGNSNLIITNTNACGSIIIRVKDKCGLITQCETEVYDTFEYKKIYGTDYSSYYKDWRFSTHLYPEEGYSKPFLIPIRCVISGHFCIKWLEQPKLREISDKLYSTYYNSYYNNHTSKWTAFPECGSLENETNEQFEKQDITSSHESAIASYTDVGLPHDFSSGAYIDNSNYSVEEITFNFVSSSTAGYVPDDGSLCGWDEDQLPWNAPTECYVQSYCYDYTYGYTTMFQNKKYINNQYERQVASALSCLRLYSWSNEKMIYNIGYYPFYINCSYNLYNLPYEKWTGIAYSYRRFGESIAPHSIMEMSLNKKICNTSNYIWEVENFGDEPEKIYIQTF